jgi:hypothetical protein
LARSWLTQPRLFLTQTQGPNPLLDSDSISIRTYFLNLLLEFIRTTYPGNLYPIGLPESCLNSLPELHSSALPVCIIAHQALYIHTQLNYLTRFFSRSDCYLPGLTRSLLYPVFMPKPSTHRMHDPGSNVPHIRPKGFIKNQMS